MKSIKNIKTSKNSGQNEKTHYNSTLNSNGSTERSTLMGDDNLTKKEIILEINRWYKNEMDIETAFIPIGVITERAEQGLDFLLNDNIDDCPLVKNYSIIREVTYGDAAEIFVSDKRDVNIKMIELDKIAWTYTNLIEGAESKEEINAVLTSFRTKYGDN